MPIRVLRVAALASLLAGAVACGRSSDTSPALALVAATDDVPAHVAVTGLPRGALRAVSGADLSPGQWSSLLRVAVAADAPPVLGDYGVQDGALRFTPLYPFDPGRPYRVRFDPDHLPGGAGSGLASLESTMALAAVEGTPSTRVVGVFPSGDEVPENLLRMYVRFSAPMGRRSGVEHIALLGADGTEIEGAVLPLDYELWSPDHTRFTVLFDPGRVKLGILPNRELGRPLEAERTFTLVISREWRDASGQPLADEYRRELRVGPADERPIDPSAWQVAPPAAGGRGELVVRFPEPLDHGLLMRALGVRRDGDPVTGEIGVDTGETTWRFRPEEAWEPGGYELFALDVLEDPSGNQIGRAFEVDNPDAVGEGPSARSVAIPFSVR
jgi:hypothetical protein